MAAVGRWCGRAPRGFFMFVFERETLRRGHGNRLRGLARLLFTVGNFFEFGNG